MLLIYLILSFKAQSQWLVSMVCRQDLTPAGWRRLNPTWILCSRVSLWASSPSSIFPISSLPKKLTFRSCVSTACPGLHLDSASGKHRQGVLQINWRKSRWSIPSTPILMVWHLLGSFMEAIAAVGWSFLQLQFSPGSGTCSPITPSCLQVVTDCCQPWTSLNPAQTFVKSPLTNPPLVSPLSVCVVCLQLEFWLIHSLNRTWGISEISFNVYFNKSVLSSYFIQMINAERLNNV